MFKRRIGQIFRSLSLRFVVTIVLVELIIASVTGTIYATNFTNELDSRSIQNARVPVQLLNDGVLEYNIVASRQELENITGQPVINAFIVGANGNIFFSTQSQFIGTAFEDYKTSENFLDFNLFSLTDTVSFINEYGHIVVAAPLVSEDRRTVRFFAFFEISNEATIAQRNQLLQLFALGGIATVVFTSVVIYVLFNSTVFSRISQSLKVLNAATTGNLTMRISNPTRDEIGVLQQGINTMINNLAELVNGLETRVADRTRDLTIVALIARQIATILNTKELFNQLVEQTASAFDFYQVSIFQYNSQTNKLYLVAASGTTGEKMLDIGKEFHLDNQGLVPSSARIRKNMLSNDVLNEPLYMQNPILPDTRSELSLPIIFGGELLGILDIQSVQANRFQESDISVFTILADQIAVTFNNVRLFEEAQSARHKAEKADKAKSSFLASTSHELRTPLNAIINLTSFIKRGLMGPTTPRQEEMLGLVMKSGEGLLNLINDVLDMSKIESGSLKLYITENVDVHPIIYQVIATAETLIQDKPISITYQIPDNLPLLTIDQHRFQQILLNIMSNACKFTEKGKINICVIKNLNHIQFEIQDTGFGIQKEDIDKVFDKFVQTESGLRQGGGTGLGMPITKNLVEAHGGQIWLESEINIGTKVYFTIPYENSLTISSLYLLKGASNEPKS